MQYVDAYNVPLTSREYDGSFDKSTPTPLFVIVNVGCVDATLDTPSLILLVASNAYIKKSPCAVESNILLEDTANSIPALGSILLIYNIFLYTFKIIMLVYCRIHTNK